MATVKNIFDKIQVIRPNVFISSSLGRGYTNMELDATEYARRELSEKVSKNSLAYKILSDGTLNLSDKQIWVVAYELLKNEEYCQELDKELEEERKIYEAKQARRKEYLAKRRADKK